MSSILALAVLALLQSQPDHALRAPAPTRVAGLGAISFANSGAEAAQAPFVRGVLLLHSFEYEPAAEAFREAQAADPSFALAYWGEAMTCNHPLWRQQDLATARRILARLGPTPEARAAKAPNDRERGYLAAVEALYGEGSKHDRDQAYMRAMARLQDAYPDDMEARAFHALAILGSRNGVRDFATYMRAAATAQPVFDGNPEHPGAAHYLIHAFDDPVHAPLGLAAARRYSVIAPGAAHAQHMTSHIYLALGMWDDVVAANIRGRDSEDADNARRGRPPSVCGHYPTWLQYGYLMRGEPAQAAALLDRCFVRMSEQPTRADTEYFVSMRARQIVDTGDWTLASRWTWSAPAGTAADAAFAYQFTNAFAALRRNDPASAQALLEMPVPADDNSRLLADALRGLLAIHAGQADQGLGLLKAAAAGEEALPLDFGPPGLVKPLVELYAEELLRAGRTDEASAAYARAAERTPGRALATRAPASTQWAQFRGPNGAGVDTATGYPATFSPTRNVAWKAAVPFGQSSPVVAGGRVYLTASEGDRLLTICLDQETGRELWRREIRRARAHKTYKANDPASPTPAADADGVVVFFADFGLAAYAPDGKERWRMPLGPFSSFYGMAASPILADGMVVLVCDQRSGSFIVAVDRKTGVMRWKKERAGAPEGWATPMVFRPVDGEAAQLIVPGTARLDAYALATGEPRWWMPTGSSGSMGTAVASGDLLFVSTIGSTEPTMPAFDSYLEKYDTDKDRRLSLKEFVADKDMGEHFGWADADLDNFVTLAEWNTIRNLGIGEYGAIAVRPGKAVGKLDAAAVVWRFQKNLPYIPAPLVYRDVLYLVKTGGIITSLDPATGRVLKQGRSPDAVGEYYASPVAADDKVFLASLDGRITVLKAGAQWDILGVNDMAEEIHATPALSGGRLYVRTRTMIYCFGAN